MPIPTGLPDTITSPYVAAQAARIALTSADATVTDLTAKLAAAQTVEAAATQTARDTLKTAEATLTQFEADALAKLKTDHANNRAALEALVLENPNAPLTPPAEPPAGTMDTVPATDPNATPAT